MPIRADIDAAIDAAGVQASTLRLRMGKAAEQALRACEGIVAGTMPAQTALSAYRGVEIEIVGAPREPRNVERCHGAELFNGWSLEVAE